MLCSTRAAWRRSYTCNTLAEALLNMSSCGRKMPQLGLALDAGAVQWRHALLLGLPHAEGQGAMSP